MPHASPSPDRSGIRIAVQFAPGPLPLRERETLRGIAQHAESAGGGSWHVTLDPYAAQRQAGLYHGILATARRGRERSLTHPPAPVVCVNWGLVHTRLTRATENRYAAGRLAAAHLVERGYRTFAYVGFNRESHSGIEREHFTRELRRFGRDADTARTFVSYASKRQWRDKVTATVGGWLGRLKRPAGLFVATPRFARLVADLALDLGLSVPEDIGIVAADNDPVLCELAPALTSACFDYAQVGRRAAELLGRLMDGAHPPKGALLIEPTLVPRRSTDRQGLADPLVAKALHWIDDRRTEFIRPADVAEAVGLSPRTLGKRMLRARGRTVMHEVVLARIAHAKLLLGHDDGPVRPIARQSGFGSYAAMLHAFRQHVGVPPAAWRRGERGATDLSSVAAGRGGWTRMKTGHE